MTLIIGLKSDDCIVIGAETEESGGLTAKRSVCKLQIVKGDDCAVVVGAAGDAAVAENAMREFAHALHALKRVDESAIMAIADKILDLVHTKYIDKDPKSEGVALVIGASCPDGLHLISTEKRVPQPQESIACVGYGADIGLFCMDRLFRPERDWLYTVKVAGFTLQQAIDSSRYCGGECDIHVLQRPPQPVWRSLGTGDTSVAFANEFQQGMVASCLEKMVEASNFNPTRCDGYADEHNPAPVDSRKDYEKWKERKKEREEK
jgi:20S proteasome alpha/beta subunit